MDKVQDTHNTETIADQDCELYFKEHLSSITYEGINGLEAMDLYDAKQAANRKTISICITVYNEDKVLFINTYFSLIKAINYAALELGNEYQYEICVIVDGVNTMCPRLFEWAANYGLLESHTEIDVHELSVFRTKISGVNPYIEKQPHDIVVNFCVSRENKGKLNSHRWFFEYFCKIANPEYVIQIDVGVTLEVECIQYIMERFSDEEVAGVAACSLPEAPLNFFDILSNWQYLDLLSERLIQWPIESSLNYVSVLPGQLHALRWQAIHHENMSLLPMYFKDVGELNFFEANMYLAEDRVLGIAISYEETNGKNWKLTYQTDAKATIDICETWPELLKQRRRWVCGAFVCKLKMFEKVKDNILKKWIYEPKKYLLSPVYQVMTIAMELLSPSIILLLYTTCFLIVKKYFPENLFSGILLDIAMVFSFAIFIASVFLCSTRHIERVNKKLIDALCLYQAIFLCFLFSIIIAFNKVEYLWVLLALVAVSFVCGVKMKTDGKKNPVIKRVPHYLFARPFVRFIVQVYAMTNIVDTCWGTKGKEKPVNYKYVESMNEWSLKVKKYSAVTIYFAVNVCFYALIFCLFSLEKIIYLMFVFQIVSSLWAILYSLDKKLKFFSEKKIKISS